SQPAHPGRTHTRTARPPHTPVTHSAGTATAEATLPRRHRAASVLTHAARRVATEWTSARILTRAGLLPTSANLRPMVAALRRSGMAAAATLLAQRFGTRTAIIDSDGALTYSEFAELVTRWINALSTLPGSTGQPCLALMCRNSRYLLISLFGALGVGARVV